jgi:hypothetical protein
MKRERQVGVQMKRAHYYEEFSSHRTFSKVVYQAILLELPIHRF